MGTKYTGEVVIMGTKYTGEVVILGIDQLLNW
jgi:hypothetical protein